MSPAGTRLLLISPVRNEAAHIERVVRSVAAQTVAPELWLVADDGSEDGTLEILRRLAADIPFMQVTSIEQSKAEVSDRLAEALEARAFNRALALADFDGYTHLGKLDGDIELPPNYFERLLARMAAETELGIVGGSLIEEAPSGNGMRAVTAPEYHVHGALKLYTRECFEAVGGIEERLGWDTIDETYARMRGYRTSRDLELVAVHHRPGGSADGMLRGRMRHGQCAYIARQTLPWVMLRSVRIGIGWSPRGLSGFAFLCGYLLCALRRADRVEDREFKRFVKMEHRRRIRGAVRTPKGELRWMTSA